MASRDTCGWDDNVDATFVNSMQGMKRLKATCNHTNVLTHARAAFDNLCGSMQVVQY
jgi:hypothetical protein